MIPVGGITRCVGVMTDPSKAKSVGPIRSCRTYFLSLSLGYDAPLFHCGCSIYATNKMYSRESSVSSWDHVDQKSHGSYYYRDGTRSSQGFAYEHTLFTTGERMVKAFNDLGYAKTDGVEVSYGYTFADKVDLDGAAAATVQIPFQGSKVTTMEYDAESGQYLAHQYNKDWIDGETGKNAQFRNILVISAAQSKKKSEYGNHSFYEMLGTGTGYYAVDGKMVPIKWQRDTVDKPYSFTYEDGTPITLGVGKTYCAIIDDNCTVTAK
jgi:hypothetical protein